MADRNELQTARFADNRPNSRARRWLAGTGRVFSIVAGVLLCLGMSVAAAGVVEALPASAGVAATHAAPVVTGSACPQADTCVSLPCRDKGHCPTVDATPTSDLGLDQWVFLNLSNFPAGDEPEVSYCTATKPIAPRTEPLCDAISTTTLPNPQQLLPIFPNGTALASFHVELNPPAPGNVPFSGIVPGSIPPVTGSFFCDNDAHKCAILVTDPGLDATHSGVPNSSNTVVIPVQFRTSSTGCPRAQFVFSSSDFSVEQLFPHESAFACTGAHPVIPVDTASDSATAVQSLVTGGTSIAFITNPLSPSVQQQLSKARGKFAIIPVAASAVVLGYAATMQQGVSSFFSFNSMRLTPSEVAGVITYNYSTPFLSDLVHCPSQVTTQIYGSPSPAGQCPLMYALNTVSGYGSAGAYGVFLPSYQSGMTRALIDWICSAPNTPVKIDGVSVRDTNLASHELTTSTFDQKWPIKSCEAVDGFPAITSPNSASYALVNSPAIQVKFLRQYLPPPQSESHPAAAFAPVDWSEARYLGFNTVELQNAAGNFVAPALGSVEAGLAAAKTGPLGVLEPSYTTTSSGAYPLPEVIYAVIRTDNLTSTTAADLRDLLGGLLTFTGGSESGRLPDGYVPLPAGIYTKALAETSSEIVAPPTKHHSGGGGGTTTSTTTTTVPVTTTTSAPAPATTTTSTVPTTTSTSVPVPTTTLATVPKEGPPPVVRFAPVVLEGSGSRLALPLIVGGGGISIIPGTLLLARRRVRENDESKPEAADPEASSPEAGKSDD